MGDVVVGTCSWTDKTMIERWYPKGVSTAEARLRYYASRFDAVEVDSTFYGLPKAEVAARMGGAHAARLHVPREGVRPDDRARGRRAIASPRSAGIRLRGHAARSRQESARRDGRARLRAVRLRARAAAPRRQARRRAHAVPAVLHGEGPGREEPQPRVHRDGRRDAAAAAGVRRVPPQLVGGGPADGPHACDSSPSAGSRSSPSTRRRSRVAR